jgi:hypothetical protein
MSDIGRIEDHLYAYEKSQVQKDNLISWKERDLVSKLFGSSEKIIWEKKETQWLDKNQKNQAKEYNKDIRDVEKYNQSLKEVKEKLMQPNALNTLLDFLKNQLTISKSTQDLWYYKNFLIILQDNIQDKDNTFDNIKLKTKLLISDIRKISDDVNFKNKTTDNKTDDNKNIDVKVLWNTKDFTNALNILKSDEIVEFKWVIDNLNNWSLSPEKIKPFASMMNVLRQMNGLSKDQIMSVVDNTIQTKFVEKKDHPEMKLFKDTLSAVLDKWLVSEFINKVDEDLNKNDVLKWLSYDKLLDKETNLSSPEARAGINILFHRNEELFKQLTLDYNDPTKKPQVERILRQYTLSSVPNGNPSEADINNANITLNTKFIVNWKEKSAFAFTKKENWLPLWITKKDAQWNDILLQSLTPFFWDSLKWESIPMEQCLTMPLMKDILWQDNLRMEWAAGVMKELVTVNGKNMSFSDAISSLFESPLFLEIKQAFLALLSMMGDDSDTQNKYAVEANFAQAEKDLSKITETVLDKNDKQISYLKALKALNLENKDMGGNIGNPKERFANAPLENQKLYIKQVIKNPNLRYEKEVLAQLWEKISSTEQTVSDKNTSEVVNEKDISKIFTNGEVYEQLSIDSTKPGKVERVDIDKKNPYLRIDGQVIPLIAGKWSLFVKGTDGQIIEKIISFDTKDNKENISIKNGETLDMWLLEKSYKDKNFWTLWNSKKELLIKKYYLFEQSSDAKNSIDQIMKLTSGLQIDQKNKVEQALAKFKSSISPVTENSPIKNEKWSISYKEMMDSLSTIKLASLPQQKERDLVVNTRGKSMQS